VEIVLEVDSIDGIDCDKDVVTYLVPDNGNGPDLKHAPELPDRELEYFDADRSETYLFHEGSFEADRCLLFGLGSGNEIDRSDLLQIGGEVFQSLDDLEISSAGVVFPLYLDGDRTELSEQFCSGMLMAQYKYEDYMHDEEEDDSDEEAELEFLQLIVEDGRSLSTVREGRQQAEPIYESVKLSRNLANTPANDLTPMKLAEQARNLSDRYSSVSVKIWEQNDLISNNFHLINAVGKGSENPPCLIRFQYKPGSDKGHVGVAGKGVTFDTGGISIKPSKNMDEMKFDMCGAAAVFGIVRVMASLELPLKLTGFVPAAENMPGHRSVKPGDIVTGYSGKSVEILNTDAEGRLCLADALGYLSENYGDDLDVLVDFATLTGACITALGHEAAGLMGNDNELCEQLMEAGQRVEEPVWQLPLWEEHSEQMDSDIADVKNTGGKAGAITAGAFLKKFVDEDVIEHWAHLDIAGTGWGMKTRSYRPEGGTGFGVRLMLEFLRDRFSLD